MNEHEFCQVQIEALKEDIHEFKRDVRDHLKEVRESHKIYAETITVLRENVVRLTGIAERQDDKLDAINSEISALKKMSKPDPSSDDRKWYQKMLENNGKLLTYILIILLTFSLGLKLSDVATLLGGGQ
jgi:hemerythrin-like domain-containing protein